MKPLVVLVAAFIIAALGVRIIGYDYDFALAARIGMCVMLLFTAVGHFAYVSGMMMMIPLVIPFKKAIVYLTGLLEIVFAVGIVIDDYRHTIGCLLMLFFLLVLPANIYATFKKIDYQKADASGTGTRYLLFRVPLQLLFIAWVYVSAVIN